MDIVVLNYLIVAWVAIWPLTQIRRGFPRLLDDPGIQLPRLSSAESAYLARYRLRMAFLGVVAAALLYVVVRIPAVDSSDGPRGMPSIGAMFALGLGGFVVSLFLTAIIRYRMEGKFAEEHPEFRNAPAPLSQRLVAILIPATAMGLVAAGEFFIDSGLVLVFMLGALIVLFVGRRLYERSMLKRQLLVELDSPFGMRVAAVCEQFDFTPTRIVLLQSLMANAGAFFNGVVMSTTALRTILTEEELLAVLAHEISHVRDGDPKRIRRAGFAVVIAMVLAGACDVFVVVELRLSVWIILPLTALSVTLAAYGGMMIRGRITRALEFKCDAAAKDHGYGPDLAVGLTRLHRYQGIPARWKGLDNRLLTHPSLEERVVRLTEVAPTEE